MSSAPYDPYIPSGGSNAQQGQAGGNNRTAALQAVRILPHSALTASVLLL